ncbi:MAG TPA: DUF4249 domain-containing protein, partial [Puia sp.]|nr:DUF4249 domain-containing protein [Puia sp.]
MKISLVIKYLFISVLFDFGGCKEAYIPPAIQAANNFLVVDGFLNYGQDSTIINLSRARSLIDSLPSVPELNAQVTVEGQGSGLYPLNEVGNGEYAVNQMNLNPDQLYRIRITTTSGEQYASDFVPIKPTPPIDSINWIRKDNGVNIYANAHDPTNNTKYYRWEYTETWEYHSPYDSYLEYVNKQLVIRDSSRKVLACWSTLKATNIFMASSANLSQDVIYESPLEFIPLGSEKISVKYSILVKQFALTREAFEYWQNLRKSTEQVGSLFDAQPSQITGNIHSVNHPGQPVLGFISASSQAEKRIYITNSEVWPWVDN